MTIEGPAKGICSNGDLTGACTSSPAGNPCNKSLQQDPGSLLERMTRPCLSGTCVLTNMFAQSVQGLHCHQFDKCRHFATTQPCYQRTTRAAGGLRKAAQTEGTYAFNSIESQAHERTHTLQQQVAHRQSTKYPFLDPTYPGVEQLHAEPPVYLVHNLLQPGHCHALQQAALSGQLPTAAYNDAVLFDYHKLSYLSIIVVAGAAAQAVHAWQDGAAMGSILQSAATGAVAWSGIAALLAAGVKKAVEVYTNGRCFTGSKWSFEQLQPGNPAAEAVDAFVRNVCKLLDTDADKLEVPLVTRYCQGEYQRVHLDARPPGDSQGASAWLAAGGQRLVQCVVYLNSMTPSQGGSTAFHHPALKGLAVYPEQGAALVFFPAYADGQVDARMAHSGEPVLDGEKWIINTWAMQYSKDKAAR